MMRVVITGATGFVGGALARALAGEGVEIGALVRPASERSRLDGLPVTWIEGDVTQPQSLRGAFAGVDWVVHAAGMLGRAGVPESAYHRLHAEGTRHVLAEVASSPGTLPRVLYVSSPGVLGPITGAAADETAAPAPSNAYERSKAAAERIACDFAQRGLPVVIARPEFIYGPGDRHVLGLFRAVQRGTFFYVGGGHTVCHPTYIDDAVDGLVRCLQHGRPGEIYHVTGPEPVTFRHLAETIAAVLGVRPPWLAVPGPIAWLAALALEGLGSLTGKEPPLSRTGVAFFSENHRFSWQKAYRELGYTPQFDLQLGVQKTVSWYRKQGLLWI